MILAIADTVPSHPDGPVKSFLDLLWDWVRNSVGIEAIYIIGLVLVSLTVWKFFGVRTPRWLKAKLFNTFHLVPKADPKFFTVALARLKDDDQYQVRNELIAAITDISTLGKIHVLRIPKVLSPNQDLESERQSTGDKLALKYLNKSRADVMVWGECYGNRTVRVSWVINPKSRAARRSYALGGPTELPAVLAEDLKTILPAAIIVQFSELKHQATDALESVNAFRIRLEAMLTSIHPIDPEYSLSLRRVRAQLLFVLGNMSGDRNQLAAAIQEYREILQDLGSTHTNSNIRHTDIEFELADALAVLGERDRESALLEEAIGLYRQVLENRPRNRAPQQWASIQLNLANSLQLVGQRESDISRMEAAVVAYREALQESARRRTPLRWATIHSNLGNVLRAIGERESGDNRLEEAAIACRKALKEFTREEHPLEWAGAQNNLGNALATIGGRGSDSALLKEAIAAYQE